MYAASVSTQLFLCIVVSTYGFETENLLFINNTKILDTHIHFILDTRTCLPTTIVWNTNSILML